MAWTGLVLAAPAESLSDHPERLVSSTQGWGVLGLDTAAHQADRAGEPLRIAGQSFARVSVNGAPHADFDSKRGLVRLSPNLGRLRAAVEFEPGSGRE